MKLIFHLGAVEHLAKSKNLASNEPNKENITLHVLHVHYDARFSVAA